jgi:hypothetical protein
VLKCKKEESMSQDNPHAKHRQRLRDKIKKSGIKALAEHEVLEWLLTYTIPRKNTNPIGHNLIKKFGSLSRVLEASLSDLTKVEDNTLQIYTGDSTIYNISDDGSTSRDIGLLWYNKDEDNTYIGFSDGIYDPTYDEIHYLEESEVDSRLVAQMGKDVPNDEIALETAADIEDAQPLFKNLRNSLTRDLRNNLNAYQNQIASIESFNDDFEALMDSIALVGQ